MGSLGSEVHALSRAGPSCPLGVLARVAPSTGPHLHTGKAQVGPNKCQLSRLPDRTLNPIEG